MIEPTRPSVRPGALEWEAARQLASAAASLLGSERVSLAAASGRVLAEEVSARQDVPHFASSAMDGWAVTGPPPWRLVDGRTDVDAELVAGQARLVVTGGMLPRGTESILRSEHGRVHDDVLTVAHEGVHPARGAHLRAVGEEAHAGEVLIAVGTVLNPAHLAVAASCAVDAVQVVRRPRVALILTGDEVIERGLPAPGRVRDSFGPLLPPMIELLGGTVVESRRTGDDLAATIAALEDAAGRSELIITTGGTGASAADHVRRSLLSLDADILVPALATRPGAPTVCARLPGGQIVLGLAGNPLAALTGFVVVGMPLLAAWTGRQLAAPRTVTVAVDVAGHPTATLLLPFRETDGSAFPAAWTGSAMMRGLADADGVLVVPPSGLRSGGGASALPLPWRSAR